MKVVVPFTTDHIDEDGLARGLRPEVKERLEGRAEFVDVGGSRTDYFELVASLWRAGEAFCLVEQDVLPELSDLDDLERCPNPWCLCPYPGPPWVGLLTDCLGCTRFTADLIAAHPKLFEELPYVTGWRDHWLGVDQGLSRILRRAGWRSHLHRAVQHLRDYGKGPSNEHSAEAMESVRRLRQAMERWPDVSFVMQTSLVGAQAGGIAKIDRAILFHHLAHAEDDLQAGIEAIRTLRRDLVAASQEEQEAG